MDDKVKDALAHADAQASGYNPNGVIIRQSHWDTIRAHIEALEAGLVQSREINHTMVQRRCQMDDALAAAEARVRELEGDARRYRWLRDDAREALCAREQGDNPIHPHLWAHWPVRGERLDAAIDSAMQGEEVRGA